MCYNVIGGLMVFKVYKNIKNKLNSFRYQSFGLISFITISLFQKRIMKENNEITKKIIDFIKYK